MALFRRRKNDVLAEIAAMAHESLARHGIVATGEDLDDPEQARLVTDGGLVWLLANIHGMAQGLPRREWPGLVDATVRSLVEMQAARPARELSEKELRARVRSRLVSDGPGPGDVAYGRPFAPGVVEVLCLDLPTTVQTLDSETVAGLALSAEELYVLGRRNTATEPIDEKVEVGDGVRALSGESMFIASKAVDLAGLVASVIGPAPHGLVFAIPNRHLLAYAVLTSAEWATQVMVVTQLADRLATDPDQFHPGGLISPDTFYWAPDGRVDRIGGRRFEVDGEPTLAIIPPDSLGEYLSSARF